MRTFLSVIVFLGFSICVHAQLSGKVTTVSDGDSFTLFMINKDQVRIELYGIDCPEHGQLFGKNAKSYLRKLIANRNVKVKRMEVGGSGRVVGIVLVGSKIINEELLRAGLAWNTNQDSTANWVAIETEAKEKKIGLWSSVDPVPPWEWRKGH